MEHSLFVFKQWKLVSSGMNAVVQNALPVVCVAIMLLAAAEAHASPYLFAQPNASSAVSIQLGADSVRVHGVTPGGTVVIFMAALRSSDGIIVQRCEARALSDADGDGVVLWPGIRVPLRIVRDGSL